MAVPFLSQVAQAYATHEAASLSEFCFVFPNKRSATFFAKELKSKLTPPFVMPSMMPVSQFVSDFSDLAEADRFEQLITLFDVYRNLGAGELTFDDFVFWGDMLLNDFNDVDRWLIDAEELFTNVKHEREISSTYLSEQQLEIIASYWGDDISSHSDVDAFWNHVKSNGHKPVHSRFLKLWEVLYPLYTGFHAGLRAKGLASQGMFYRNAVEAVAAYSDYTLPFRRYIFVGFNVLSTAEMKIFSRLQHRNLADFYWDFASPAFTDANGNRAGKYVDLNRRRFPSRYPVDEEPLPFPKIDLIGVPSRVGQTKVAGDIIRQWVSDGKIADSTDAVDTAVILPDESLFVSMIHSIPESITKLNVTMGFPVKLTPVAALMRLIVRLQMRATKSRTDRLTFFYDDVLNLLSMPMLRAIAGDECEQLSVYVRESRLFRIPLSGIEQHATRLLPLFAAPDSFDNLRATRDYILSLLRFLSAGVDSSDSVQQAFIDSYTSALESLCNAATSMGVDMKGATLLRMVERVVASATVSFTGEPLQGLQLMGMLETRALDFKNVVILSLNERIFPKRYQRRSFIPDTLRTAYHLDNIDFQESVLSYYFYRILSRAENVALLYDSRSVGGVRSNEMSRFAKQLLFLYPEAIKAHTAGVFKGLTPATLPLEMPKDRRILGLLDRYRPGGDKNFSPSAINTYINCPLNFYLSCVEELSTDNETVDYVDASTFGDIFHRSLETFYSSLPRTGGRIIVTPEIIDSYLLPDRRMDAIIEAKIRECYRQADSDQPLAGETLVLSKVIRSYIDTMLRQERDAGEFEFVAGEFKMRGPYRVNESLTINVRQIIDRIDIKGGVMRFIDYKTGSDTTEAPSVESIFDPDNTHRNKALLQQMFYCNFWRLDRDDDRPIRPLIYSVRQVAKDGLKPIEVGGAELADYHAINDEYLPRLNAVLEEIFDPDVPFRQAESSKACMFCSFKTMCDRQ